MSANYVLTSAAEADLVEIIRYTRKQWGEDQIRRYAAKLANGMKQLSAGEGTYKELSDIHPGLRMARCEHHYLFCLPRDTAPALIIAIFHERMDVMARLANRIG